MSTTLIGADADELERIAAAFRAVADELSGHADAVSGTLRSVEWVGGVATRFGTNWNGAHRPRLASSVQFVREAAAQLERNAAEQRQTSQVAAAAVRPAAGLGGSGSYGGLSSEASLGRLGKIERLIDGIGLAHEQVEIVADAAARLGEHGEVGRLIDVVTHDAFATFLAGADHVIDAGSVIVDSVSDFADHEHLQFDERVVHSLADTATRFGLDQGMETAAEWMVGAATAALLPGFGAILAPLVGEIAGALAGEFSEIVVTAIDGAIDAVDVIADAVVAAYQDIKQAFGVVADVAAAAVEVAGDAIDLAGDAAGAVLDASGSVLRAGAGVAGGVYDVLNPFGGG